MMWIRPRPAFDAQHHFLSYSRIANPAHPVRVISRLGPADHAAIVVEEVTHFVPKVFWNEAVNCKGDALRQEPGLKQDRLPEWIRVLQSLAKLIARLGH